MATGLDPDLVVPIAGRALGGAAPRPASTPLITQRGRHLPPLADAIGRFARALSDAGRQLPLAAA